MVNKVYDLDEYVLDKRYLKVVCGNLMESHSVDGFYSYCQRRVMDVPETVVQKLDRLIALVQQSNEMGE